MAISDRQKRFFAQKPANATIFKTIEYYHPTFGSIRLLQSNGTLFFDRELTIESTASRDAGSSVSFKVTSMSIQDPKQGNNTDISMSATFPSIDAGKVVRDAIKSLSAFDWFTPIEQVYRIYRSDDTSSPLLSIKLFLSDDGVTDDGNSVTIRAADDNPSNLNVSRSYTVQQFPGLINS